MSQIAFYPGRVTLFLFLASNTLRLTVTYYILAQSTMSPNFSLCFALSPLPLFYPLLPNSVIWPFELLVRIMFSTGLSLPTVVHGRTTPI